MVGWLKVILIAAAVMVALWALLVVLAARLPAGLLRDLAGFLPPASRWPVGCARTRGCRGKPRPQ
jgi:hypothetical protein